MEDILLQKTKTKEFVIYFKLRIEVCPSVIFQYVWHQRPTPIDGQSIIS